MANEQLSTGRRWLLGFVALCLMSCGDPAAEEGQAELRVTASPLYTGTTDVWFFVAGEGIRDDYRGTRGSPPGGSPPSSLAWLTVPEGRLDVHALGWERFEPVSALTDAPSEAYHQTDGCYYYGLRVQGGTQQSVSLDCPGGPTGTPAQWIGVEHILRTADYHFNALAPYAGSFDGSNITRIVIDGAAANASVLVEQFNPGPGEKDWGLACFETLPVNWPHPSTWENEVCSGTTNGDGDWVGYIVVHPDAAGRTDFMNVTVDGVFLGGVGVRIAGMAHITAVAP